MTMTSRDIELLTVMAIAEFMYFHTMYDFGEDSQLWVWTVEEAFDELTNLK